MEVFGLQGYEQALRLSPRMLLRAAEAQRVRDARQRLAAITDASLAAGLKLGQKYVDPKNPAGQRKSDEPYYTLEPLLKHQEALEKIAVPWEHTLEKRIARRIEAENRAFEQLDAAMGAS